MSFNLDIENDELIPIENNSFFRVDQILNENEHLIQYYIDENNVLLFSNDNNLDVYLENIGRPLKKSKIDLTASSSAYQDGNLEIYLDCCYDSRNRLNWSSICYTMSSAEERLKDFSDSNNWVNGFNPNGSPLACDGSGKFLSDFNLSNPNDRMNSVIARNVFARFHENINYGGRSIVLDARNGGSRGFRKLRKVRHRGTWGNRISSIRLTN